MSLINEALKKAQRQRTEGPAGVPPPAAAPTAGGAPAAPIAKRRPPMPARTLVILLVVVLLIIPFCWAYYHFIERPFLGIRLAYTEVVPATAGAPAAGAPAAAQTRRKTS